MKTQLQKLNLSVEASNLCQRIQSLVATKYPDFQYDSDFSRINRIWIKANNRSKRRLRNSAVLASTPPEPAVIKQVVTETTQGATYFLCSNKNYCICDFSTQDEPRTCQPCFVNPSFNPVIQLTDSFFDLLPLSVYSEDERVGG